MKKFTLTLFGLLIPIFAVAQIPQGMSYQAVIRDASGTLITNQSIGFKISILQGSDSGTIAYQETHLPTTNTNGLISLVIGNGSVISGDFETIDWANGPYFIKTETDINGGSNYTISGTSQMLSVPYALYANNAGNVKVYNIGDYAQGGVVFWLDETKQHGLVCSTIHYDSPIKWYNNAYLNTEAHGNGIGAGYRNTTLIMATQGSNIFYYAAGVCGSKTVIMDEVTYGDWYLPSKTELEYLYEKLDVINAVILEHGGNELVIGNYWTSNEIDANNAQYRDFSTPNPYQAFHSITKSALLNFRAIRRF